MAKTLKAGNTKIKGATAADKKVIEAAKASVRAEDTPEAKATLPEKKAAAEEQFAKADKAGDAQAAAALSRVVRGY